MTIYTIQLEGIHADDVFAKYYSDVIIDDEDFDEEFTSIVEYTDDIENNIPLTKILHEDSTRYTMFVDNKQMQTKVWFTMHDYLRGPLPITTDKPCWWCKDTFNTCPLGVPIKHIKYENGTFRSEVVLGNMKRLNIHIDEDKHHDYFITDGIVCSFPCMKAYILDNSTNIMYKESMTLMSSLFIAIYGKLEIIPAAGNWRTIDKWLGHLSIEEFRSTYCRLVYTTTQNIKRPIMFPAGSCIEEHTVNAKID